MGSSISLSYIVNAFTGGKVYFPGNSGLSTTPENISSERTAGGQLVSSSSNGVFSDYAFKGTNADRLEFLELKNYVECRPGATETVYIHTINSTITAKIAMGANDQVLGADVVNYSCSVRQSR